MHFGMRIRLVFLNHYTITLLLRFRRQKNVSFEMIPQKNVVFKIEKYFSCVKIIVNILCFLVFLYNLLYCILH